MTHFAVRTVSILALLTATACTQAPARIDMLGSKIFSSRPGASGGTVSGGGSYSAQNGMNGGRLSSKGVYQPPSVYSNTPRPQFESDETHQDVYVAPVEKADLAAPAKPSPIQVNDAQPVPFSTKPSAPVTLSDETGINPWTKKPRGEESSAAPVSEESQKVAEIINDAPSDISTMEPAAGKSAFMWPVSSKKVIAPFGPKSGGTVNDGINIAISEGEPVWASADGEVVYVGSEMKGYGNMVILKHDGGKSTTYAHMNRATVDKYDRVKQGDIIGYVGATGNVKSPQLHFAIRNGKAPLDPQKILPSKS